MYSLIPCELIKVSNSIKTAARANNPNSFGSSFLESIATTTRLYTILKAMLEKIHNDSDRIFEVLFLIDADQFIFALEAAEAELTAARIEVEGLKSDYRQYGAELKEADERIRLHKLKLKRICFALSSQEIA